MGDSSRAPKRKHLNGIGACLINRSEGKRDSPHHPGGLCGGATGQHPSLTMPFEFEVLLTGDVRVHAAARDISEGLVSEIRSIVPGARSANLRVGPASWFSRIAFRLCESVKKSRLGAKAKRINVGKGERVVLLSGGNPQIAKGDGDAPVQAYMAAMPGWKSELGKRLDALIVGNLPNVRKAVRWNTPFYGI